MKSILMSIKPQYVAKILNGEKTIEIRKTMPKCDLPIDVYIYCTKGKPNITDVRNKEGKPYIWVLGDEYNPNLNGKVVAKFTLNKVEEIKIINDSFGIDFWTESLSTSNLLQKTGLLKKYNYSGNDMEKATDELAKYIKVPICVFADDRDTTGAYAWRIDNLEIFDKPKELWEFKVYRPNACDKCWCEDNEDCLLNKNCPKHKSLTKAPQSMMYIEIIE